MRRLLILILAASVPVWGASPSVAYTQVDVGSTSSAINTTGASLLVIVEFCYNGPDPASYSPNDSKSNSWHYIQTYTGNHTSIGIWYAWAPTVGTSHTFSAPSGCSYGHIDITAYSGVQTLSNPLDKQNGYGVSKAATIQPGSITPTVNGELIVSACASVLSSGAVTVDSGFAVQNSWTNNSVYFSDAYLVQSTAAAINPTWTVPGYSGSYGEVAVVASFKPASITAKGFGNVM